MKKLWQTNQPHNPFAAAYCFGEGARADNALVVYDIWGSIAHAAMLERIGVLTRAEFAKLKTRLLELIAEHASGAFLVTAEDEDVHTKLEAALTESLGELGARINLGRSRNDQVLTALRLCIKDQLFAVVDALGELAGVFLAAALKYEFTPMPGYTHMQRAMPSSVGMWCASFVEGLLGDLELLKAAYALNNQSPLGSGASYGVPLSIDREYAATVLGFASTQRNALAAQASRVKVHYVVLAALTQIMLTLGRFAADVLLFTTAEFGFFAVDPTLVTGSSIMPQKRNLDVMEILRARVHAMAANTQSVAAVGACLPSGYNADVAETKRPLLESFQIAVNSLKVAALTVQSITPNAQRLRAACTPEIFATHAAYELAKTGVPFRQAHQRVAENLDSLETRDPVEAIKQMTHTGAPGNLGLAELARELEHARQWWEQEQTNFQSAIAKLTNPEIV